MTNAQLVKQARIKFKISFKKLNLENKKRRIIAYPPFLFLSMSPDSYRELLRQLADRNDEQINLSLVSSYNFCYTLTFDL
jgi:hypothetical protein